MTRMPVENHQLGHLCTIQIARDPDQKLQMQLTENVEPARNVYGLISERRQSCGKMSGCRQQAKTARNQVRTSHLEQQLKQREEVKEHLSCQVQLKDIHYKSLAIGECSHVR